MVDMVTGVVVRLELLSPVGISEGDTCVQIWPVQDKEWREMVSEWSTPWILRSLAPCSAGSMVSY